MGWEGSFLGLGKAKLSRWEVVPRRDNGKCTKRSHTQLTVENPAWPKEEAAADTAQTS